MEEKETWYGHLNYWFLQLFFIRLARRTHWYTGKEDWTIVFKLPFTGWL